MPDVLRRVVLDTNIVVSALFWGGPPRELLDAARVSKLKLFTSATLLAELEDVLAREKFSARITRIGASVSDLVLGYGSLAEIVTPDATPAVIEHDPDDDAVLACAAAASAEVICSGDSHLLTLKTYRGIRVLTAADLVSQINEGGGSTTDSLR